MQLTKPVMFNSTLTPRTGSFMVPTKPGIPIDSMTMAKTVFCLRSIAKRSDEMVARRQGPRKQRRRSLPFGSARHGPPGSMAQSKGVKRPPRIKKTTKALNVNSAQSLSQVIPGQAANVGMS